MKKKHKRLAFILLILAALSVAAGLAMYALQDNISYFYAPAKIRVLQAQDARAVRPGNILRLGGIVTPGSITGRGNDMVILFTVTDYEDEVRVAYDGILPDLFREGQGIIARGTFDEGGMFIAERLFAKHDENYMPPEVKKALEQKAAP